MKAVWNGAVIAESNDTVVVEGNHYFPRDAVKGEASYFNVVVDGQVNEDAAWYYPEPKERATNIKGYVAFWRGVDVEA